MATQFQHRLVGTILLVALGVIFLPDLLDGKQPPMPDEAVSIPLRPELEPARPAPVTPESVAEPAATADTWTLEEVKEAPPAPPKPQPQVATAPAVAPTVVPKTEPVRPAPEVKPAPKPVPVAPKPAPVVQPAGGDFIVQLGAFRNADNVNALVRKLQGAGYRVQTTPSVPRQGQLNRVWVGPDAKARLEQQLPALERLTGLKGRVMTK